MSTDNKAAPTEGNAAMDLTKCPHWGKGGRYVIDIANGQRVPVPAEMPADAVAAQKAEKTVKENKRA